MMDLRKKAQEMGWYGHDSYREADAWVSGYKFGQKAINKMLHDIIISAFCSGVWT